MCFRALRNEINRLECKHDHESIYNLLHRLAQWDRRLLPHFPTVRENKKQRHCDDETDAIVEVVDMTGDEEDREIIDVDTYILEEVLLLKVIKPDPDAVPEPASQAVHIKEEPMDDVKPAARSF